MTKGLTYAGPRDKNFKTGVLFPTGIRISIGCQNLRPEDLLPSSAHRDANIVSRIFLNIEPEGAGKIASQLLQYHQRGYDETAITKIIIDTLAPFDYLVNPDDSTIVTSLCRDKWKPNQKGPVVSEERGYTYDWEIEPDMTYMASINIFDQNVREALQETKLGDFLAESYGVCPYLTVEYKCTEKGGKDSIAVNQMAVASVIWIHQRKLLKDALKSSDTEPLQHYSIKINATDFQVWVTKFDGKKYIVQMVGTDQLHHNGIENYIKWWNAIHAWGLGPNAQSFKRDIETLLENMQRNEHEATTSAGREASEPASNGDTNEVPSRPTEEATDECTNQPTVTDASPGRPKKRKAADLGMTPPLSDEQTQRGARDA